MAQLRRLREQFPDELVIISVHSAKFPTEKETTNIREAVMRHGIDHPVVNDADFEVWQQYAIRAWPTLVLIDPRGKVVDTQSGEILAEEYAAKIEALIADFEAQGLLDRTPLDLRSERQIEPDRPLNYPSKLLMAQPEGSITRYLFIADTGHHRILQVALADDDQSGEIVQVFGSGIPGLRDGSAAEAQFHDPHGMALNGQTLYVADTENHAIRAIDLVDNTVRTVAGTGRKAHGRLEMGEPTEVSLRSPWALWAEEDILLIAMAGSHQIWALVSESRLGIFAGTGAEALVDGPVAEGAFNQPSDVSVGFGHMFVADSEASAIRAVSLGEDPRVMTLVGQGLFEFGDIDGTGGHVRLQHPTGLTFYDGLVYIADSYNHKIKTLDLTTGTVMTLIGTGQPGHTDGAFSDATLYEPEGVVASDQRLYIADTNNHLIRVADLETQSVQTVMLRGLAQLAKTVVSEEKKDVDRLAPVTVAPGEVEITLAIELPEGYKLNPDAPQMVQWGDVVKPFDSTTPPTFTIPIEKDTELDIDVMLYYCQAVDERLCFIHTSRMRLPLTVSETGERQVEIHCVVENKDS
ncbi:MAG: NHL domain-containing thioredoxin family protein [Anaerolineae bacterium]|nr:NHL domain-containing thioredoxin family protein [Anaerolineae bacterium]